MTISVVLRLIESALASGRVAGEAEVVDTGERVLVRDEHELLAVLRDPAGTGPASEGRATDRGGDSDAA